MAETQNTEDKTMNKIIDIISKASKAEAFAWANVPSFDEVGGNSHVNGWLTCHALNVREGDALLKAEIRWLALCIAAGCDEPSMYFTDPVVCARLGHSSLISLFE